MRRNFVRRVNKIFFVILAVICIFPDLTIFLSDKKDNEVKAANFSMQTGYYIGTGTSLDITGVGFQPDLVMTKSDTTAMAGAFKTSAMGTNEVAPFAAGITDNSGSIKLNSDGFSVYEPNSIQLDSSGFTVRNGLFVNQEVVRYTWVAFGGSDCSANGTFCVGSYIGTGASSRAITTGFQPGVAIVKSSLAVASHFQTYSEPDNEILYFHNAVRDTTGNFIKTLDATGFTVGSSDNTVGVTYYYITFKTTAGRFAEGTYTANNTDNRSITGVGFKPDFAIVKNATNATANNTYSQFAITETYGDNSNTFGAATASTPNGLQALEADGFQVGTLLYTNGSASDTHYWMAFGGATDPSGSGTFKMKTGSYVGNGTGQNITGVGFQPDVVIIKSDSTQYSVFATKLVPNAYTMYLGYASGSFRGGIISLDSDGFTLGPSVQVSNSGTTFQWIAFGNAFDPIDNSGAADFMIGAYFGNGIDNRNIDRLPFQPDLVVAKRNAGTVGVFRSSIYAGDLTSYFTGVAETANMIQALNSDGFQIGTGTEVNTAANTYYWFAFKDGTNFVTDSYGGTGVAQNIDTVGFQPEYVWIKQSSTAVAVAKPAGLAGDSAQYFANTANATGRITGFISGGFSVGTQAEVNTNGSTYRYIAWNDVADDPTGLPSTPNTPTFTNTASSTVTINWNSTSGATSYKIERAADLSGTADYYYEVGRTSNTSFGDTQLVSNRTYWYRVTAMNSNGSGTPSTGASVTTSTQSFAVQTGSFMGTGGTQAISNIGFSPDFVMLKSFTATIPVYIKFGDSIPGFTSSSLAVVDNNNMMSNYENIGYGWVALAGNNCTAGGSMCVGMYWGNGASSRTITTGFQPGLVIIKSTAGVAANFQVDSQPDNETLYIMNTVRDTTGNFIKTFTSSGFTIGGSNNTAATVFYYVAIKEGVGSLAEGTYTANNTDNRAFTGLGFKPGFVLVKNATNTTANNTRSAFNIEENNGDYSFLSTATASAVNNIQSFDADGFTVGTTIYVNGNATNTHYWFAFPSATSYGAASGTYKMQVGSYSGNGTTVAVTGLGFRPDMVIIKGASTTQLVFRTKMMYGDTTAYLGTASANITGAIRSLDSDGFTLGSNTTVNGSGTTYQWIAFGNAYDPYDNSGAADFAIGAYYGNGIDGTDNTRLPFQPDVIGIKINGTGAAGALKTSSMTGDLTSNFINVAEAANLVQAINSDGFEIGTSAYVNTANSVYYWFAFKDGTNLVTDSYSGTGVAKDIDTLGFQPNLVWVKGTSTTYAVTKPSSLAGDSTQFFYNAANASGRVTGMISGGFSVGTQAEVNTNGSTYRYIAWKIPASLVSITVSNGTINYGNVNTNATKSTIDLSNTQTITNNGDVAVSVNIKSSNATNGNGWTLGGSNGNNIFMHEFSTNSGSNWTALTTANQYQQLTGSLSPSNTQNFDMRITIPSTVSDYVQKSITITLQAVAL